MTTIVETLFPTEAGVYPDIPEDVYHQAAGFLSSTGARTLVNRTPAHFAWDRAHGRRPKRAFDLGTAAHASVLGKGAQQLVPLEYATFNTKAAQQERDAAYAVGKTPLLTSQVAQVETMAGAVRGHAVAGKVFGRTDCQAEVTFVGQDPETGVWCRARADWLLPIRDGAPITVVDLKTTDDASQTGLAKSMVSWGYAQQLDHYADTIRWALGLDADYPVIGLLFAVEKDQPHLVGMGQPDQQAIAWAHEDNRRARHIYRRCAERNQWPGYDEAVVPLSLPGWRLHAYENQYPTGLYEPDEDFGEF